MECLFCGMEITDTPFRRGGEIYCSKECADADSSADETMEFEDYDSDDDIDEEAEELDDSSY